MTSSREAEISADLNRKELFRARRSIRGWVGSRSEAVDALTFSAMSGIVPMIEVVPLEQAALAYERMMTSKVHFRSVLRIGDLG
jgi:D-arabinose 1-dehydrogenase-like Zn-dependent alcohol dehydrogenase